MYNQNLIAGSITWTYVAKKWNNLKNMKLFVQAYENGLKKMKFDRIKIIQEIHKAPISFTSYIYHCKTILVTRAHNAKTEVSVRRIS